MVARMQKLKSGDKSGVDGALAIRPFVIGRKAWLFSDTPVGVNASAIIYSLLQMAKAICVNARLGAARLRLPPISEHCSIPG